MTSIEGDDDFVHTVGELLFLVIGSVTIQEDTDNKVFRVL